MRRNILNDKVLDLGVLSYMLSKARVVVKEDTLRSRETGAYIVVRLVGFLRGHQGKDRIEDILRALESDPRVMPLLEEKGNDILCETVCEKLNVRKNEKYTPIGLNRQIFPRWGQQFLIDFYWTAPPIGPRVLV